MRALLRLLLVAAALCGAVPAATALAHELLDHPAPPPGGVPAPSAQFTSGGEGAKWEFVGTLATGNPHSDLDFFERGGETFASVGTLAAGANGGGQNVVQLTDKGEPRPPRLVGSAPTAECASAGSPTGLQHDVEATPKGDVIFNTFNPYAVRQDAQLLIDASDAPGRCHDQGVLGVANAPRGGLEIIDVTDPARPQTIGLTSHIGMAHTVNVDPKRPHIAYAVTSDTVSVNAQGRRENEIAGDDDAPDLDGFEVVDLRTCMNFAPETSLEAKRDACRPTVYRYRYPSTDISIGHLQKNFVFGCHELEIYPDDRLTCGSGPALIVFDMSGAFDDRGTPDDYTDDTLRGTPLPCSRRASSSTAPFTTQARVVDCVLGGENRTVDLSVPGWRDIGSPSLEGVRHLGSIFHQGGHPGTNTDPQGQDDTPAAEDVKFNHESELSHSGNLLIATDERGGGLTPPGATCPAGNTNPFGNGGVHFYRVDRLRPSVPATAEEAYQAYARTPQGGKAIFRVNPRTGTEASTCTAHVMQQIPGQNRIFMGWYSQGTQVLDFTEHADGTVTIKDAGFFLPAATNQWVSHIFKAQENPDGTFTYWGATGDLTLGDNGRNAVDVYKVTLPAPPLPADGPGLLPRRRTGPAAGATTRSGGPACVPSSAFRSARVRPRGRRLTVAFQAAGPVTFDLFRQSAGRRVLGERLVRRVRTIRSGATLPATDRRGRRLGPGFYVARLGARAPSGVTEYRRVALRLRGGRFRRLPAYSGLDSCGLIRNFKLERPVFGGRSNRALSIAFRAGDQVRAAVTVRRVGGRVVKRFPERSYAGGLVHRLRVTVSRRRFRGGRYVVTLRVRGPGAATRTARRVAFRL